MNHNVLMVMEEADAWKDVLVGREDAVELRKGHAFAGAPVFRAMRDSTCKESRELSCCSAVIDPTMNAVSTAENRPAWTMCVNAYVR